MKVEVTPETIVKRDPDLSLHGPGIPAVMLDNQTLYKADTHSNALEELADSQKWGMDWVWHEMSPEGALGTRIKHGWWDERWKLFTWNHPYGY